MTTARKAPFLLETDTDAADPATAAPVPDHPTAQNGGTDGDPARGRAMRHAIEIAARRGPSPLGRFLWASALALITFVISVSAWQFTARLLAENRLLGWTALALISAFALALLLVALRELAAFARLARIDGIQDQAERALAAADLGQARSALAQLERLYRGRPELRWGRARIDARSGEILDADGLIELAEREYLAPLDEAARREIQAAARRVATVTALVPLALADVITALTANLRMIRRIAEIYGGRAGLIGGWRLTRAVMTHLVATGAVAVGDDLVHSLAGGTLLSKLSRRFGEGVVNGALTARVGVAAIEVCRPLPFRTQRRPSVSALVGGALGGLFGEDGRGGRPRARDGDPPRDPS